MARTSNRGWPIAIIYLTLKCGCEVVGDRAELDHSIEYCPTHAEAPNLLEALERVVELAENKIESDFVRLDAAAGVARTAIEAATA